MGQRQGVGGVRLAGARVRVGVADEVEPRLELAVGQDGGEETPGVAVRGRALGGVGDEAGGRVDGEADSHGNSLGGRGKRVGA